MIGVKILTILAFLGVAPAAALLAEAATATDTSMSIWMTGAAVLTLSGLLYKQFLKVQGERDALLEDQRTRFKEDREVFIPALIRNTEVLARVAESREKGEAS